MKRLFKMLTVVLPLALIALIATSADTGNTGVSNALLTLKENAPVLAFAAAAKNELAAKELIKHFRHAGTWLARVPSKNKWVGNDVIRLNEIGADPVVLINNNTYPINVSSRTDSSTAISLHKYDTENTSISDDEIYALPYDKPGSVQQQHRETLEETTQSHGLHSLAPMSNTANTPILETTGEDDGTGRLRLVYADLVRLKTQLDTLKVPKKGRILVVCPDHVADLLLEDKALQNQYQNHKEGAITMNYCGFEMHEDIFPPEYDASLDKIPYDSVTSGTAASVVFHVKASAKARGSVKRYLSEASKDPQNRQTLVGFRLYFIAIPTRLLGQAAIVSGSPA